MRDNLASYDPGVRTSWPFTGRTSTLDEVDSLLRTGGAQGVVVAGAAGVGKTRLVREALDRLEPGLFTVLQVGGTAADAGIPFGAFGHVLPVEGVAGSVVNPLRWASEALRSVSGDGLLVAVDDAHLLDPNSAALVHHLVLHREAQVLATVRTGAAAPDPVTALWKDDLARRVDLVPLTKAESQAVVEAALGGQLAEATARRLYHSTQGNLLFLRELVLAGLAEGRLAQVRGVWQWDGDLPLSPKIMELIEARLGTVGPAEREVLEYVALGEPLGAAQLVDLTSEEAVERAEARNLIASAATGRRIQVRPAHPLYGEAARVQAGAERVRGRLADLAAAMEKTGMRRHGDLLRVATWHLDSGTAAAPQLLLAACRQAWTLHDMDLALRCGRAALDAGVDVAATIWLASVLLLAGHPREAEEHLARIADEPMDEATRVSHATVRAFTLGLGMGRAAQAERLLGGTLERTTDPALRREVVAHQAIGEVYAGRLGEAVEKVAMVRTPGLVTPRAAVLADAVDSLAAMLTGEFDRAVPLASKALDEQDGWIQELPTLVATFNDARAASALFAGDLDIADSYITYGEKRFAEEHLSHVPAATSRYLRVHYCMLRGEIRPAVRWAHEAAAHGAKAISALSGHGYEVLAYAAAAAGDADTASAALDQAERRRVPTGRIFHFPGDVARAWIRASTGDLDGAARIALEAADRYAEHALRPYVMVALHDAVRLGAAEPARAGLARLAGEMDGALAGICARHAAAAADRDAEGLDEVSRAFADRGMALFAAEAAAQASRAYGTSGRTREANAAATHARLLAARCPDARTPALTRLDAPELTARQLEIARLAADGLSNREIADRLVLSVRTVANHLQAVYDRLGVRDRDGLRGVIG
ncbi:LuxR C-terminal-related transcriptional regulator [Actinomadura sp. NBRC 104412]|uniref:LuxR C-terminal-related transcriptional regulator n=1 Tax=Actinomadura sp. NBRC 104412 TaxID=3032203 RepID=UPI00331F1041